MDDTVNVRGITKNMGDYSTRRRRRQVRGIKGMIFHRKRVVGIWNTTEGEPRNDMSGKMQFVIMRMVFVNIRKNPRRVLLLSSRSARKTIVKDQLSQSTKERWA